MYCATVHTKKHEFPKGNVQLVHFRHKGLRHLHQDGNAKGVPSAMADKLRKLLFALETAETLEQVGRFPGWKLRPLKGELRGSWSLTVTGKLAAGFPLRRTHEHRQRN
jgi:toxin HigB-1